MGPAVGHDTCIGVQLAESEEAGCEVARQVCPWQQLWQESPKAGLYHVSGELQGFMGNVSCVLCSTEILVKLAYPLVYLIERALEIKPQGTSKEAPAAPTGPHGRNNSARSNFIAMMCPCLNCRSGGVFCVTIALAPSRHQFQQLAFIRQRSREICCYYS